MAEDKILNRLFPRLQHRRVVSACATVKYKYPGYRVHYSLHRGDEDKTSLAAYTESCFGSLASYLRYWREHNPRYMLYKVAIEHKEQYADGEPQEWIKLGQAIGVLPADRDPQEILDGLWLDLDAPDALIPTIYMRLCWVRWLREAPGIVKHSLQLVNVVGCDPWAAVAYTHNGHVSYLDQSLLPYSAAYLVGDNHDDARNDLAYALQLHRLTHTPDQVDDRHFKTTVWSHKPSHWTWQGKAIHPPKKLVLRTREMMLSPEAYPIIASGNFERAVQLAKSMKGKSNVQFAYISD